MATTNTTVWGWWWFGDDEDDFFSSLFRNATIIGGALALAPIVNPVLKKFWYSMTDSSGQKEARAAEANFQKTAQVLSSTQQAQAARGLPTPPVVVTAPIAVTTPEASLASRVDNAINSATLGYAGSGPYTASSNPLAMSYS
jgi:hypothetical protein